MEEAHRMRVKGSLWPLKKITVLIWKFFSFRRRACRTVSLSAESYALPALSQQMLIFFHQTQKSRSKCDALSLSQPPWRWPNTHCPVPQWKTPALCWKIYRRSNFQRQLWWSHWFIPLYWWYEFWVFRPGEWRRQGWLDLSFGPWSGKELKQFWLALRFILVMRGLSLVCWEGLIFCRLRGFLRWRWSSGSQIGWPSFCTANCSIHCCFW